MFAVVNISGFQEIVHEGDKLTIPLQEAEEGSTVTLNEVLMVSNNGDVTLGKPMVSGASVQVKVLQHGKDAKIRVFKFRRRKRYMRTKGHKQQHTKVEVTKIIA